MANIYMDFEDDGTAPECFKVEAMIDTVGRPHAPVLSLVIRGGTAGSLDVRLSLSQCETVRAALEKLQERRLEGNEYVRQPALIRNGVIAYPEAAEALAV